MTEFPRSITVHPDDVGYTLAYVREECARHGIDHTTISIVSDPAAPKRPPPTAPMTYAMAQLRRDAARRQAVQWEPTMRFTGPR